MLTEKEKKVKFSAFVELNIELIAELVSKIQKVKRNNIIMYADIINLIIRKRCSGEYIDDIYNNVITWCIYKIKNNNVFVEFLFT